jgi:hypothetical protein
MAVFIYELLVGKFKVLECKFWKGMSLTPVWEATTCKSLILTTSAVSQIYEM